MTDTAAPLRVLYVDDDEMALTLTQLQLLKAGIHTETTTDALEAVGILSTQPIDLILLDSVMPTIDGVEFLHLMQSLNLPHPVVFFSGYGVEELREAASAFRVLGFLNKQHDRFTLPAQLRELHRQATVHEGDVASGNLSLSPPNSRGAPRAAS